MEAITVGIQRFFAFGTKTETENEIDGTENYFFSADKK